MNSQELTAHEALLLGSKLIPPMKGVFDGPPMTAGCALAMICDASGISRHVTVLRERFRVMKLHTKIPCHCFPGTEAWPFGPTEADVTFCLVHLFDDHVCPPPEPDHRVTFSPVLGRREPWTIEQVAEWLRDVEATLPVTVTSPVEKPEVEVPA